MHMNLGVFFFYNTCRTSSRVIVLCDHYFYKLPSHGDTFKYKFFQRHIIFIMFIYLSFEFFLLFKLNLACQAQYLSLFWIEQSSSTSYNWTIQKYFTRNTSKKQFIAQLKITTYKSVNISSKLYFYWFHHMNMIY